MTTEKVVGGLWSNVEGRSDFI